MKDHTFLVIIMQFETSRWFSTSIYAKWLPLKLTWTQKSYSHIEHEDSGRMFMKNVFLSTLFCRELSHFIWKIW